MPKHVPPATAAGTDSLHRLLHVARLHADYARAVDAKRWEEWVEFFTDDCVYRVQARENHERGLPLAVMSFESKGMLKDRAYGISETLYHDPYYQRHVVGLPVIHADASGVVECEANFAVFRVKYDELPSVYCVGRYIDRLVDTPAGLRIAARVCVYDSEMIANSLIYPV